MSRWNAAGACVLLAAVTGAAGEQGIPPRPGLSDYAAHEAGSKLTVAADALTAESVKNGFATDLNKGWMVVEIAVYPGQDPVRVDPSGFMLRLIRNGRTTVLRPAEPKAIASILQRKEEPKDSDITLYPTVGVGYETGGYYDPLSGSTRGGGVRTSVGIGVGIGKAGPPAPAGTPADRKTMELELTEKGLPEGTADKPMAGYLYFPKPSGKLKNATLELHYASGANALTLVLAKPDPAGSR